MATGAARLWECARHLSLAVTAATHLTAEQRTYS
eukprot:COSAG01_NODE_28983_length_648_cov_0.819672_3_plen_33_part_01